MSLRRIPKADAIPWVAVRKMLADRMFATEGEACLWVTATFKLRPYRREPDQDGWHIWSFDEFAEARSAQCRQLHTTPFALLSQFAFSRREVEVFTPTAIDNTMAVDWMTLPDYYDLSQVEGNPSGRFVPYRAAVDLLSKQSGVDRSGIRSMIDGNSYIRTFHPVCWIPDPRDEGTYLTESTVIRLGLDLGLSFETWDALSNGEEAVQDQSSNQQPQSQAKAGPPFKPWNTLATELAVQGVAQGKPIKVAITEAIEQAQQEYPDATIRYATIERGERERRNNQ